MNKLFKRTLASILTSTSLLTGISSVPAKCWDNSSYRYTESYQDNLSLIQKVKNFISNNPYLAVIPSFILTKVCVSELCSFGKEVLYQLAVESLRRQDYKQHPNAKKSTYTQQQEGACWCWIACLQGQFEYLAKHKMNLTSPFPYVSQEKIFESIFKVKPSTYPSARKEGKVVGAAEPIRFIESINSITNGKIKFRKGVISTKNMNYSTVKNCIIDYYKSIGETPFSISDNSGDEISATLHAINIIEVDNKNITIEDPATGLSWEEETDTFCKKYFTNGLLKIVTCIEIFSLSYCENKNNKNCNSKKNSKMLKNIYYYCNNNYSSFSKVEN